MPDNSTQPPDTPRNTVRAGTQNPFDKDAADQASERAKGEAKRPSEPASGGRRLKGGNIFRDYEARQAEQIDKESK